MLQRTFPWVIGGVSVGLIVSLSLWLIFSLYLRPIVFPYRNGIPDQSAVTSLIESSVANPDVQSLIRQQVVNYLKTPEGRIQMAEALKSPEMVKAMSENLKSPQMQAAVLEMMKNPKFRQEVMGIVKDAPEMKLLMLLSSAITLEETQPPAPESSSGATFP